MTSPRVQSGMPSGPTVASGMPMNMQDLFTESEDPFISLNRNKTKPQFMSPPFCSRFDGQPTAVLSPDNPRLQSVIQQNSQFPKQFDQLCVPPSLQPLNATLNQLQAQLDSLRPLLYGFNSDSVNAVSNHAFEMASPTLTNLKGPHHRATTNSYSDAGNRVFNNNAFEVPPMQSQNMAAAVTRSQIHDPTAVNANGGTVNGRKQPTGGSQLNPLAHAYSSSSVSSMSGIPANFDALSCLKSLTSGLPTSGNCDNTNTPAVVVANGIGLGLGAPLFTHSGGTKSTNPAGLGGGGASAARQLKNFSNGTNNVIKPVSPAITVSAGSGGRYSK